MKKRLAVLCGIYYPNPSPTGLCAKRYADLVKDEYDVDIIFMQDTADDVDFVEDGFHLHSICGKRLKKEYRARGLAKKIYHTLGQLEIKLRTLGNMAWYRREALRKLQSLHKERPFDAVFTVCSPFAAHLAGADFKRLHPEVRFAAYTVDPYSAKNRIRPFFMSGERLADFEKGILSKADYLLLSEEVYASRRDLYENAKNCAPLPYVMPEFSERSGNSEYFDSACINCVYAGRFYEDIRSPEYLLKTFSLIQNKNIKLHLFSVGCKNIVNRYAEMCENIIIHQTVSQDEIKKVYAKAHVLIGVGNTLAEFMPSKTYEYIAALKPIVYINQGDNVCEPLKNYSYALQLSTSADHAKSAEKLEDFINQSTDKTISSADVEKYYEKNTPEYISKILKSAFCARGL